jgi:hypothetical protein
MTLLAIDPVQAAIFVFGLVLAWVIVRLVKARQAPQRGQAVARGGKGWMPAAVALALLLALWLYLS